MLLKLRNRLRQLSTNGFGTARGAERLPLKIEHSEDDAVLMLPSGRGTGLFFMALALAASFITFMTIKNGVEGTFEFAWIIFLIIIALFLFALGTRMMLERSWQIIIDKRPHGNVTVDKPKWIVKDERFSIPRTDVTAIEIEDYYQDIGPDPGGGIHYRVVIVTNFAGRARVIVEGGDNKDKMLALGRALSELLNVELVDNCKLSKPWWS